MLRKCGKVNIICDYILAEETEINRKNSTKEGRIKVVSATLAKVKKIFGQNKIGRCYYISVKNNIIQMHAANASNIISESDYGIHTNLKNREMHFMNKSKGDRVQNTKGRNKNASGLILYFIQHADNLICSHSCSALRVS